MVGICKLLTQKGGGSLPCRGLELGFTHSLHTFHTGGHIIITSCFASAFSVYCSTRDYILTARADLAVKVRVPELVIREFSLSIEAGVSGSECRLIERPEHGFGGLGRRGTRSGDLAAALNGLGQVGKDVGLTHNHLLGLREEEGGNTLELRGQELAGGGDNVDKAEQRGLVQCLDRPHNLLAVGTLVAVKENGDIGVCGH